VASAVCLQRPAGDISDKHCQALHSIAYVAVVFANPMCYLQVLHFMLCWHSTSSITQLLQQSASPSSTLVFAYSQLGHKVDFEFHQQL